MGARTADATAVQSLEKSADSLFDFGRVICLIFYKLFRTVYKRFRFDRNISHSCGFKGRFDCVR